MTGLPQTAERPVPMGRQALSRVDSTTAANPKFVSVSKEIEVERAHLSPWLNLIQLQGSSIGHCLY